MGTSGKVTKYNKKDCNLDCKGIKLSTCKIKKAGIGGPLITFDGSFVGMNFYDGSGVTPFVPKDKNVQVLNKVEYSQSIMSPIPIDIGGKRKNSLHLLLPVGRYAMRR
uniref:Uncharacterized protein n=1 Tax=Leersia perrieri TaxID=77586 RepID=A0A0D9XKW4_9ORYZ